MHSLEQITEVRAVHSLEQITVVRAVHLLEQITEVRAVHSLEMMCKRCAMRRHFEHAQNKRRGLAFAQRVRKRGVGTLLQRSGVF